MPLHVGPLAARVNAPPAAQFQLGGDLLAGSSTIAEVILVHAGFL
jgi:hypothetical protein